MTLSDVMTQNAINDVSCFSQKGRKILKAEGNYHS